MTDVGDQHNHVHLDRTDQQQTVSMTDPYDLAGELLDVIDLASDQDKPTWVMRDGKRVAAVVPVEVLEHYDELVNPQPERRG